MIPWPILKLLARRYAIYGAAVLALVIGLRWWGNRQYDEGRRVGAASMVDTIAESVERARQEERRALELERQYLDSERQAAEQARLEAERIRAAVQTTLNQRLASIEGAFREETVRVAAIDSGDLPDAIRTQLAVLRAGLPAADLGGAAGSPGPAR